MDINVPLDETPRIDLGEDGPLATIILQIELIGLFKGW